MIQYNICMTFGSSLWEAIYMAHDLIAYVADILGFSPEEYVGMMDLNVELTDTCWGRKGEMTFRSDRIQVLMLVRDKILQ